MKMKRIVCFGICIVMALPLAGCKPDKDPDAGSAKTSTASAESDILSDIGSAVESGSSQTASDTSRGKRSSTPGVKSASPSSRATSGGSSSGPVKEYVMPQNPSITKSSTMYYVYVNDMMLKNISDREKYDQFSVISSLQGVINRNKPCIFIEWENDVDRFWYDYITADGRIYDGMNVVKISTFEKFVETFLNEIKSRGLVVWDKTVPATSNVAATVCGADGCIPVRYETNANSVYTMLTNKYKIPVKVNLAGKFTGKGTIPDTKRKSSGSAKCDAYLWAIEKYLNKTSPDYMAYFLDAATWDKDPENPYYSDFKNVYLPNRDYAIARKAFFFDLSSWGDEKPCDDPGQPMGTDLNTLKEMLQRQYDRSNGNKITQISGYTPWQIKYTTWKEKGSHPGVDTEWEFTEIITAYNCVLDADSAAISQLSNASMYMHFPLKSSYKNSKPLVSNPKNDKNKKYVFLYIGDYDSAAWLAREVPKKFTDKNRGKVPLAWAFNPNLSQRVPMVFDYIYSNKTAKDFFVTGDSGAGYVNPSLFLEGERRHSSNPSGMNTWISWNKYFYRKFDLSITGFILNGNNEIPDAVYDAYLQFSPKGAVVNRTVSKYEPRVYKGMPLVAQAYDLANGDICASTPGGSLAANVENTANLLLTHIKSTRTNTYSFRTVLCSPTFIYELYKAVRAKNSNVEFPDPYTFFELVKQQ